jgi:type II secretory pathway pseudopilin PulG
MNRYIKYQVLSIMYEKEKGKGFSLIELILYVALLMIIVTGLVTYGVDVVLIRTKVRVEQEVIANARLVSKRINLEIRDASALTSVGSQSITLANSDASKNPTVIAFANGRVTIGWGSIGNCPTSAPCYLTSSDVVVQSLVFANLSNGTSPQSVKYEVAVKAESVGSGKTFYFKEYATGSAEVRSK